MSKFDLHLTKTSTFLQLSQHLGEPYIFSDCLNLSTKPLFSATKFSANKSNSLGTLESKSLGEEFMGELLWGLEVWASSQDPWFC